VLVEFTLPPDDKQREDEHKSALAANEALGKPRG
jgi:hypothetical protein